MSAAQPPQQYVAIANHLREDIRSGKLAAGDTLPSEAQLCEQFNSSRGPVRQAMATLRSEGLISSGRGRRSIVLDSPVTETFDAILSPTTFLQAFGITPAAKTEWLARRPAPADIAEQLEIAAGDPIVTIHRLRLGNGLPLLVERQDFRMDVGRHIFPLDTDTESIHKALTDQGVTFDNVSRVLTAVAADEDDARLLDIEPGVPLIQVNLRAFTHAGTPVELAEYRYRADRISFGMNSVRGNPSPLWARAIL